MILLAVFAVINVRAQTVNVVCEFSFTPFYTCNIRGLQFADVLTQTFEIIANHVPGLSNSDVFTINIQASQTPFVIPQLLTTFPNAQQLSIISSGLTRIQANAFVSNSALRTVIITGNPLTSLPAHTFFGSLGITSLELQNNQINNIDVDALYGLHQLRSINVANNQLQTLPSEVFAWRGQIRTVDLSNNRIEILPGELFQSSRLITQIDLANNRINALGRQFITNLNDLSSFNILNNVCVSRIWTVGSDERNRIIPEALEPCFVNYEA